MRNMTQFVTQSHNAGLPAVSIRTSLNISLRWAATIIALALLWIVICTAWFYLIWYVSRDRGEEVYEEDLEGLLRLEEGDLDVLGQMHLEQREEWAEDVFIGQPVGRIRI